jgi:predicted permease
MPLLVKVRSFLRNLFLSRNVEVDLDQEVHAHVALLIEENIRAGMSPKEAQRAAWIELGGIEQVKEQVREKRIGNWLHSVISDCRYGFRMLRKSPGISLVAVITLALGIGANTTIFNIMNGIFFRPLPFRGADRLVVLNEQNVRERNWTRNPAMATIFDWEKNTRSFEQIELAVNNEETANLTLGNETERLKVQFVTVGLPDMLGIEPVIGHGFQAGEPTMSGAAGGMTSQVLISQAMWQRHWAGDPGVLGKQLTLLNGTFTIVGVMPTNAWVYPWLKNIDVWMAVDPASSPKEFLPELRWLGVLARLKPDISLRQARAEMNVLGRQLADAQPETNRDWTADVLPPKDAWFAETRKSFYLLLGAVGFVLLIACANVANLLLARAGARTTEMAIRASMGCTRARILRQLLTESVLLGLIGGALGLALSYWGVKLFVVLLPDLAPLASSIVMDATVLTFTLALAAFTGILFGAFPALQISTSDLNRFLKEGGDRSGGGARNMGGSVLVVGEIALTLILLAGAGLMINSFVRLQGVDFGYNPAHLLTASVELDGEKYKQLLEGDLQRATPATDNFFQQTLQHLQNMPGVISAALEGATGQCLLRIAGRSDSGDKPTVNFAEADSSYVPTMQIHLISGRNLTATDDERSPWVALINATMAARFFPNESPLGKQIYLTLLDSNGRKVDEPSARVIVGVVADAKEFGPSRQTQPTTYVPYRQHIRDYLGGDAYTHFSKRLLLRTSGNPLSMAGIVRSIIGEVDRTQVVTDIRSMEQIVAEQVSPWRFMTQILGILAGIAITLAVIGTYGVMSYIVSRRTHEIGVRMALGARSSHVLGMVIKQGLKLTVPGIMLGLAGALMLTRFIGNMLYGVPPTDLLTFSVVSVLLAGIALAACYFPARRATGVDPVRALRNQ